MKTKSNVILLSGMFILMSFFSCEKLDELLESETDKTTRIFTQGGMWTVDSLVLKTDVLSGGISKITSDSTFLNYGTIEFKTPNEAESGYGSGLMIHRYTKKGKARIDTLAWVPYNFKSVFQDKVITVFTMPPIKDPTGHKYLDLYLDLKVRDEKKVKFSGWRRETITQGSGGSFGWYQNWVLSRK